MELTEYLYKIMELTVEVRKELKRCNDDPIYFFQEYYVIKKLYDLKDVTTTDKKVTKRKGK